MKNVTRAYHEAYPRAYRALKKFGFSATCALTILVDARRHDKHAMFLVKLAAGRV